MPINSRFDMAKKIPDDLALIKYIIFLFDSPHYNLRDDESVSCTDSIGLAMAAATPRPLHGEAAHARLAMVRSLV